MSKIVVFDLDGTLALIDHRRHHVTNGNHNWPQFYADCIYDAVNEPVADTFRLYRAAGYPVWISSGRSDEVRKETISWLQDKNLMPHCLLMRVAKDHQPDHKLKRSWLLSGQLPKENILCVFDDRTRVVDMWRAEGLTCFQVAPGNF